MIIRKKLFEKSPYECFDNTLYGADMQGWGSDHPIFGMLIEHLRPRIVIEVGSWKGRSSINMARKVASLNLECEIVCVDTWLGSPEHWLKVQEDWYSSLKIMHGYPQLYWTFLSNVVREGFSDIITPFPSTSENAAYVLSKMGIQAELCYIDAAHEYEAVLRDLELYWPLVAENGVLLGDDYIQWDGVTKAANEFSRKIGVPIYGELGKFMLRKNAACCFGLPQISN